MPQAFKDIVLERVNPTDADLASDEALAAWLMHHPIYWGPGIERPPLDFDDVEFYCRFNSFSQSVRRMRKEARDPRAMLRC